MHVNIYIYMYICIYMYSVYMHTCICDGSLPMNYILFCVLVKKRLENTVYTDEFTTSDI